jgi:hypothetical protein
MNQNFSNQAFNQNKIRNRFPLAANNAFAFQPPQGPNSFIPMSAQSLQQMPPIGSMPPRFANPTMTQSPFSLPPQLPPNMFPNSLHPFPSNVLPPLSGPNGQIYNQNVSVSQFGQTTPVSLPHMIDTSNFPVSQTQSLVNPGIMSEAEFYKYQEHLRKEKS